jgi:pyruvate dehydrogenase E1 component alpha subunit
MTAVSRSEGLRLYRSVVEIRHFEQRTSELYREGVLPGFIHVSLGQEACAAGACLALREDDYITSTHRGHGHCLAKGADPNRMMAELFAKASGYSRGRGGSMHIADIGRGILGANGIVGQSAPLALGAALTADTLGTDQVALAFFGEGASGSGPTLEAMNIAGIWKLPVIFFCEVNRYSEFMPYSTQSPITNLADRAAGFGFPGVTVDGSDAIAVFVAVRAAVERARKGEGATFVEAKTHRWRGHYEGDPMKSMAPEDVDPALRVDPLATLHRYIVNILQVSPAEAAAVSASAVARIDAAVEHARAEVLPDASVLLEDVYV